MSSFRYFKTPIIDHSDGTILIVTSLPWHAIATTWILIGGDAKV